MNLPKSKLIIATILLSTIFLFSLISFLQHTKNNPTQVSYYHWKSTYKLNNDQLKQAFPHQLYIKFLDIGYSNKLEVITTRFQQQAPKNTVPVVYIDNQVFKHEGVERLYSLIKKKISHIKYPSLQLDCDWSLSTKKKYFTLLKRLGRDYPQLSATIRLHQVKYFKKTGVPPVKRGVLMYYNMSDIQDISIKNYILDLDVAKSYHVNFDQYPLALDLALPLYHQIRVIRQNKITMILTGKTLNYQKLEKLAENKYKVKQAHYLQNNYLYEGDLLLLDAVSIEDLRTAAQTLKPLIQPTEVIFYEFSYAKDFGYKNIARIAHIFD